MTDTLIVVGGGGHARVVIEAARSAGRTVLGFVDPKPCDETIAALQVDRLGDDTVLSKFPRHELVLGIGATGVEQQRRALVERTARERWATIVHCTAWVSPSARTGTGAVILAGAIVNARAKIGPFCVINTAAVIEHDVVLDEFSQVGPRAVLGGGACIGESSFIGMGAIVRDHVSVGPRCMVAMGAVVAAGLSSGTSVRGVPAKVYATT